MCGGGQMRPTGTESFGIRRVMKMMLLADCGRKRFAHGES